MRKPETTKHIGIYAGNERVLKAVRDKVRGCLRYSASKPDWEVKIFDREDGLKRDGLILLPRLKDAERLARSYVRIDGDEPECSISIDNASIGSRGADFFIRRGYRTLAFVGSNLKSTGLIRHSRARQESFVKTARKANATVAVHEIDSESSSNWILELEKLTDFIKGLPKPCGLMACADEVAKSVLDACRLAHVSVPDKVALLGVDNEVDLCENLQPTLSSILPDFERSGYIAARLLDQAMRDGKKHPSGKYVYGIAKLVERESTTDLRGGGRLVSRARELIRTKALAGITVAEIAARLNVSPRLLEMRFREITGHSAQDEIISLRMDEARRLLVETKMTVADIATACGWKNAGALQAVFKRRFKQSPLGFRKLS